MNPVPPGKKRYERGDQVLLREVWQGKIWSLRPVTAVEDTQDVIALYMAPGTPWKRPVKPTGQALRLPSQEWALADVLWDRPVLRLNRPGDPCGTLLIWDNDWRFLSWYLNLEEPLRRTPLGFDYMDQTLDIVVRPDLSRWEWKDEDEMDEAVAQGIYSAEQAGRIRAEGERALARLLAMEAPLDRGWPGWRPEAAWPLPAVMPGWDRL